MLIGMVSVCLNVLRRLIFILNCLLRTCFVFHVIILVNFAQEEITAHNVLQASTGMKESVYLGVQKVNTQTVAQEYASLVICRVLVVMDLLIEIARNVV